MGRKAEVGHDKLLIGLVWVAPLPADDEGAAAQHAAALQRLPDGSGRRGAGSRDGERELVQIPCLVSPVREHWGNIDLHRLPLLVLFWQQHGEGLTFPKASTALSINACCFADGAGTSKRGGDASVPSRLKEMRIFMLTLSLGSTHAGTLEHMPTRSRNCSVQS